MEKVTISQRFCGPPNSGNGGYSAGLLAKNIIGPSQVRLFSPPPLDTPMDLSYSGSQWQLKHGDVLVGTALPTTMTLDVPPAPTLEQAIAGRNAYPANLERNFNSCFVCGPSRNKGDGLRLFSGPVNGRELVACDWRPDPDLVDTQGNIAPEFIWSALDCPGFFSLGLPEDKISLLAQMTCSIDKPIPGHQPLIIFAWKRAIDGRKGYSAAALANAKGQILARAEHLWIQLKQA
jgi:hypothetical protein